MWMMGYNNDGSELNMEDAHPFGSRKLRPLMPRPSLPPNPPCISRIHALNHHHHHLAEQSKRELNTQTQIVVSSRWNPTQEQLQSLEELYRRGTRTPSADQIQHITSQLRRFGKIEGKNVFYWFQNHKARERQKRRRQRDPSPDNHHPSNNNHIDQNNIEKKESGSRRAVLDVEDNMINWATPPTNKNCSNNSTLPQKPVPIQTASSRTGKERTGVECLATERNDTWHNLINSTIATLAPCSSSTVRIIDLKPHQEYDSPSSTSRIIDGNENGEVCFQESTTLELFPLRSENDGHGNGFQRRERKISGPNDSMDTPYQFFEFLPLKN